MFKEIYIGKREYRYKSWLMCHMVSTNIEELHAIAKAIGLNRKWFQDKGRIPHYDVSKAKKLLAIKLGANELNDRDLINILKYS
jgi:hypothetical protein